MVISFSKITKIGNNCAADMFFDKFKVAEIYCTPKEFDEFFNALTEAAILTPGIEVTKNG